MKTVAEIIECRDADALYCGRTSGVCMEYLQGQAASEEHSEENQRSIKSFIFFPRLLELLSVGSVEEFQERMQDMPNIMEMQ